MAGKTRRVTWRSTNEMLWGARQAGYTCEWGKTGWIPNVLGQKVWGTFASMVSREVSGTTEILKTVVSEPRVQDAVSSNTERFLIVVLGCKSRVRRFIDSRILAQWAFGIDDGASGRSADADCLLSASGEDIPHGAPPEGAVQNTLGNVMDGVCDAASDDYVACSESSEDPRGTSAPENAPSDTDGEDYYSDDDECTPEDTDI